MAMKQCALTTFDNDINPFEDFISWFMYDIAKGYKTCELLARFANTSEQFSDEENFEEEERAIDEIIRNDPLNRYKKVCRNVSIAEVEENKNKQNESE